jgi:glycosyltransferase 2 family protein
MSRKKYAPTSIHSAELWTLGGVLTFFGITVLASIFIGDQEVFEHIAQLDIYTVYGLLSLSLINYFIRAIRWHCFTRQLELPINWLHNSIYYVAGFAMTITPGKLGEALRLWLLHRSHRHPYEKTAALLITDRLNDAGAVLLLCFISAASISSGITQILTIMMLGTAIVGLTCLCLQPSLLLKLTGWVYGRVNRKPRLFARIRHALRQMSRLATWRVYGGMLLAVTVGWFAEVLALDWLLVDFGQSVPLMQTTFIFGCSMLIGAAAMLPGGIGGTEISMVGLLVAAGVDLNAAIAATAVLRVTTLWFSVGLGFIALPVALWIAGGMDTD